MATNMTDDMLYDLAVQYRDRGCDFGGFICPECTGFMEVEYLEDGTRRATCSTCGMYADEDDVDNEEANLDEDDFDDTPEYCRIHCGGFDNYPACFDACGVMNGD